MILNNHDFKYLCELSELKDNTGKRFYLDDHDIAVFKLNEKIYAVGNICPHQQADKIYEGFIEDGCVVCPLHGWMFNLENGRKESGGGGLDVYETEIRDSKVFIKLFNKKLNW